MRSVGVLCFWTVVLGLAGVGCEDPPPKTNPFENPAAPKQPPPITETPKSAGPPDFQILAEGPKIGWTNILLEKADGPKKLREEIAANSEFVNGKDLALTIDRKAQLPWVREMLSALDEAGATGFEITTTTRPEFATKTKLAPLSKAKSAPSCSVVSKVLSERRNAVWHLKGGTAIRSPKGLAGPDMAMTVDNLGRAAKACKESTTLFVSADDDVEWGLVYDLAAAARTIEGAPFDTVALIPAPPTAGRPVEL
jgi:biopolymer transport protein ExbD